MLNIEIDKTDAAVTVRVSGELDTLVADQFIAKVKAEVPSSGASLVIDFAGLTYISSAGLRAMLILKKTTSANDVTLKIINMNDTITHIFEITGFKRIFG